MIADGTQDLQEVPWRWGTVNVPSQFIPSNRRVVISAVANLTKATEETERPVMVDAVVKLVKKHQTLGHNILIHTQKFANTKAVEEGLKGAGVRGVVGYVSSRDRDAALRQFKANGGVLLAASMERGIDLPGDLCRVQIICKVPFPYLGDPAVSTRSKQGLDGQLWYDVKVVRLIVQMTGRAVRNRKDWALTYILDSQMLKNWGRFERLFPKWWLDATEIVPPQMLDHV